MSVGSEMHIVLNEIFMKCDNDRRGVVEIDVLLSFLIAQDPSWQGNEFIKEEFRKKLLYHNESSHLITQDHFISSLVEWFESMLSNDKETINDEDIVLDGKSINLPNSTIIGNDESLAVKSGSSTTHDTEENSSTVYFDEQILTANGVLGNSVDSTESPQALKQLSLIKTLEEEIHSLQRKNEYLEDANSSLVNQMSLLEETISKYDKQSLVQVQKLEANSQLLDLHKQKQEETEEKLNKYVDENKSVTIQLSQSERENSKLKECIERLEKQVDNLSNEKTQHNNKINYMQIKIKNLSGLQSKTQEELDSFKIKEQERKEAFEKVFEENKILQSQLESSVFLTQDLKCELANAHKELSDVQNKKLKNIIQSNNLAEDISADNSMVFFSKNCSLDNTIPFENSLLAELQDKIELHQQDCGCVCMKNISFSSSTAESSDAAMSTDNVEVSECGTMTTADSIQVFQDESNLLCKDVGVTCSIKTFDNITLEEDCKLCHLKTKRSLQKWTCLCLCLLLFCFLLGFASSALIMVQHIIQSPKPSYCLSSIFDFIYVTKNVLIY